MPARAGNTTYIPGRGATTVKPSGKKTFVGKGPAPAGATKLPEPSASEVPTVTVSSSGAKATGFESQRAAKQALRAQRASRLRTKAVLSTLKPQKPVKPVFTQEGPQFYKQAQERNERWAKPGVGEETRLAPSEEQEFRQWVKQSNVPFNVDAKQNDYNMRGYWKATGGKSWQGPGKHFPDTFKTVRDTTFSAESKYAKKGTPLVWRKGNRLVNRKTGRVVYAEPKQDKAATARRSKRPIQKVIAQDKRTFAKEQGPRTKPLPAAELHPRAAKRVKAQLQKLKSSGKSGRLPYLETPEQQKVAKTVLRTGQKMHADRKEKLAAAETGLVESSFKNLPVDAESSAGWRQERGIYYPEPTNVKKGAKNFFTETKTDTGGARGRGQTPGQLAQTVQASAYPERYDEHATEARQILHAFNQGKKTPAQKAQLAAVEAKAERLGINPKAPNVGKASKQTIQKFKAAVKTMGAINSKNFPYVWGGGHGSFSGPYDCSGAISAMIHSVAPNRIKAPLVSGSMGEVLKPGPGAITVFYNSVHTFAYIPSLHKYWGTSESNAGGGAGFFPKSVGDSEVASGNSAGAYNVGHVPGLGKKEAFQLGATDLGSAQSLPGMSVSPSGTTATIESGAGTTQTKPGFSSSPIRLTPGQRVARTNRKLKALGVGSEETSSAPSTSISDLEKKYGQRAV